MSKKYKILLLPFAIITFIIGITLLSNSVLKTDYKLGNFILSESLHKNPEGHIATPLKNGDVLITGLWEKYEYQKDGCPRTLYSELYNFNSDSFEIIGTTKHVFPLHKGITLSDGRVLLTGGKDFSCGGTTSAAEIYNPATKSFQTISNMHISRVGHTLTLIPNGHALIIGGHSYKNSGRFSREENVNIIEEFDPKTLSFKIIGQTSSPHAYHTTTLLPNGKLLVAGGETDIAEIINPKTGKSEKTLSLLMHRTDHTAVLLKDGNVLILGGSLPESTSNTPKEITYSEIFDSSDNTFRFGREISCGLVGHETVLLTNGDVLITGTRCYTNNSSSNAWLLNPSKNKLYTLPSMQIPRAQHRATLLPNDKVLITGGYTRDYPIKPVFQAELYINNK